MKPIAGFSKLTKQQKIDFLVKRYFGDDPQAKKTIEDFWHPNPEDQKIFDEFSENTITNFYFPYGVVPNMLINEKFYTVPMVIEESSVVAACARSAKFWAERGGFKVELQGTEKVGQVHLDWAGNPEEQARFFERIRPQLLECIQPLETNMRARGGGLRSLEWRDKSNEMTSYSQIWCTFETCDAMGANFINSLLEKIGETFRQLALSSDELPADSRSPQVIMAILSNYTPECLVSAHVECSLDELTDPSHGMSGQEFAHKFARAVEIAKIDVNRATTHNKGIFNGIDAVVLATGNDFRAVEACGHTFAARDGQYRGLSDISIDAGRFKFSLKIPLALGTVGGLTSLHPMAKASLAIMGSPSAGELMGIAASIGLAQNFAALRSLVTSGIQKGHMKMHLMNILNHIGASEHERALAKEHFKNEVISFRSVSEFIENVRQI